MSNGADPTAITDGIAAAQDAFEHAGFGQPTFEEGIDSDEDWTTQLTKACQLIDGARTIREHNGHYTAVIELCFGAIERSLEAWLLSETGDEMTDLTDHVYVYERVDQQGLFSDGTGHSLATLYSENRNESYYADRTPTREQAAAMIDLAAAVHDHIGTEIDNRNYCTC